MVCEYLCDFCTNGITFVRLQLCLLGINHLQSAAAAPCQKRPAKVENGTWPAEDSVPTEGSRKSCQAEKSGEKMDNNVLTLSQFKCFFYNNVRRQLGCQKEYQSQAGNSKHDNAKTAAAGLKCVCSICKWEFFVPFWIKLHCSQMGHFWTTVNLISFLQIPSSPQWRWR